MNIFKTKYSEDDDFIIIEKHNSEFDENLSKLNKELDLLMDIFNDTNELVDSQELKLKDMLDKKEENQPTYLTEIISIVLTTSFGLLMSVKLFFT